MRILVSGGAGYIGSTLVEKLMIKGKDVLVIDNLSRGDSKYLDEFMGNSHFHMINCDTSDRTKLFHHIKGFEVDAIIHLAAVPGLAECRKEPKKAILTNILGTYNLLEISRELNVTRFIFSSSGAVYGLPIKCPIPENHQLAPANLYGVTKLAGEKLLEEYSKTYGLHTTILRLGNVYGIGRFTYYETVIPKFIKQAYHDRLLTIYGNGEQGRDFIHIDDVTEAFLLTLLSDEKKVSGEIFNVGIGKAVSIKKIAEIVTSVFKEQFAIDIQVIHLQARLGEPDNPDYCYEVTKITDALNFQIKWSVIEGIEQIINDYQLKVN